MGEQEQRSYNVTGMTCEHCAAAVNRQLSEIPGVSGVNVDLASGVVLVQGSAIDGKAVRGAVRAAGYDLAERAA
jgi:copper chaperone